MAAGQAGSDSTSFSAGAAPAGGIDAADGSSAHDAPWLELWYQPKIDLRRKCLTGAEALACLHHPDGSMPLPESSLAQVDESYRVRLAEYALVALLEDWLVFDSAGFNMRLAIEVPMCALVALPIAEIVADVRPTAPHWPGLTIEVAEEQIVRNIAASRDIAKGLRAIGIFLAIRDFGAGYSSLSSLRDLAFAEIKLNPSFVHGCAADATNAAICQTAIDVAHHFGSTAVAEGIDNFADLEALQIMGCDVGQGALVAPLMRREQMIALLHARTPQRPADAG